MTGAGTRTTAAAGASSFSPDEQAVINAYEELPREDLAIDAKFDVNTRAMCLDRR